MTATNPPASPKALAERSTRVGGELDADTIEAAARYVLENSRRGNASLNDEQFAADTDALMKAYRDIIGKAAKFLALAHPAESANCPVDPVQEARREWAATVEGDSDNPLRVAEANAILNGDRDAKYGIESANCPVGGEAK